MAGAGKILRPGNGFTLIELSIVLVIIGLIVGGVLVGRDLISAAAVRAQISQIEKYQQATNTFKGKYGYLPGDIKNQEAIQFGFASRGPYAGEGNGDGKVEGIFSNNLSGHNCLSVFGGEQAMFWADLTIARLVDGSFSTATSTSVISTSVTGSQIDKYFPKGKIGSDSHVYVWCGGWSGWWSANAGDGLNYFAITNVLMTDAGWGNLASSKALFTAAQAYATDKKVDDGLPQSGAVMAIDGSQGWASGDLTGAFIGDQDGLSGGPVTAATVSPYYVTDNGGTISDTCYNDFSGASHTKSEHYSIEVNNGTGVNCALSFKFQ